MTGCKSWCTLLSKLWTDLYRSGLTWPDLCRSGIYVAQEVMKHAWNNVQSVLSPPLEWPGPCHIQTRPASLCRLPNCRRQQIKKGKKKNVNQVSKAEWAQIRWGMRASTALPCLAVCHNQSILGVVTRSWIIDSCRQLTAYVTADSVKHHTVQWSGTAASEAGVDIHSVRTQVIIVVHGNADKTRQQFVLVLER